MSYNENRKTYNFEIIVLSNTGELLYVYATKDLASAIDMNYKYNNKFYDTYIIDIKHKNIVKKYNDRVDMIYDYKDEI